VEGWSDDCRGLVTEMLEGAFLVEIPATSADRLPEV